MKKIILELMMMVLSVSILANTGAEIEKEVTGVDQQTLEKVEGVTDVNSLQKGEIIEEEVKLNSDDLKKQKETIIVTQEVSTDGLEDELNQGLSSDKTWWRYLIGGALLLLGVAAF